MTTAKEFVDLTDDEIRQLIPIGSIWRQNDHDVYLVTGHNFQNELGFDVQLRHLAHGYKDWITSFAVLFHWTRLEHLEDTPEKVVAELVRLYKELN